MVIEALIGNNFIEELYLSGNSSTDYAVESLIKLLTYSDSRLKCLGFGENSLSSAGIARLAPILASHLILSQVQLHDNPMSDEGVNVLFREIRDTHVIKSLNIRNTGIRESTWGPRLSLLSSLATLNISFNDIDDNGFVLICDGLQMAFSLRHLNIAHNKFGGKICKCISKVLSENKSLFTLDMSGNYFHHEVLSAIATGLYENYTLMELSLMRCNVPDTGYYYIPDSFLLYNF